LQKGLVMDDVGIFSTILSILRPNGIFYGHSVHLVVIWYVFHVLVYCTEKNLATLLCSHVSGEYLVLSLSLSLSLERDRTQCLTTPFQRQTKCHL
jgi:hypothetical protein